jgi:hypothetical protein
VFTVGAKTEGSKGGKREFMTRKINIEITAENAVLMDKYGKVRGLAGAKKVEEKALTAGTAAVNKALTDIFKGDAEFQDFMASIPSQKAKTAKPKPAAASPVKVA